MHQDTFQIIWGHLCLWILSVGAWALWSMLAEHVTTTAGCAKQPSGMEGSRRQHAVCLAHLVLPNCPCGWEISASNHASHSSRKKQRFLRASLFPRRIYVSSWPHYLIWQPFLFEFLLLDPNRWLITISFMTLPLSSTSPAPLATSVTQVHHSGFPLPVACSDSGHCVIREFFSDFKEYFIIEKWEENVVVESLSWVQLFVIPMDYSLSGSSVHGISQARILEWVAISYSNGSSQPGIRLALAGGFFTTEPPGKPWPETRLWLALAHSDCLLNPRLLHISQANLDHSKHAEKINIFFQMHKIIIFSRALQWYLTTVFSVES